MSKTKCELSVHLGVLFFFLFLSSIFSLPLYGETLRIACFEKDRLVEFENGQVKGFAVDVFNHIAEQEGWSVEYLPGTLPESITRLSAGEADLILTLGYTEERSRRFAYSSEVLLTTWGRVFTSKGSEVQSLIDLEGKRVGYVDDSFFYPIMRDLLQQFELECTFVKAKSYDSMFQQISVDRLDAGLADRLKAYTLSSSLEISENPIVFHPFGLHIVGAGGDPQDYLVKIDSRLRELKQNKGSVYYSFLRKWLSESGTEGIPYWFVWLLAGVAAIIILISLWSISLRQQVKSRTAEIEHLQSFLANIIDSMPSIIITVDKASRILQWNRQAELQIGLAASKAEGKILISVYPKFTEYFNCLQQAIQTRQPVSKLRQPHVKEGVTYYEDFSIYPLVENGVQGAVIRIDDVSEKVHLEETMVQSEKMVSVGGLAAGMAHEINNPLAGIIQNASVVMQRLDPALPVNQRVAAESGIEFAALQRYLEQREVLALQRNVVESGKSASRIVKDMLTFARKGNLQPSCASITKILDTTVELAQSDYRLKKNFSFDKIEIRREYQEDLPDIECEIPKIQQVILNILRNGAEAMYGQPQPRFILRASKGSDYVQIEIDDNGPGLSQEVKSHLFEPFYTTKEIGRGTGLGLSVSYFIITEGHGGEMMAESEPGHGACFIIRLPVKSVLMPR